MKKQIVKSLALGTAFAATAFLASCDGDDGAPGQDGQDGQDGRAADLPVAAPTNEQLAISTLSAVVDDPGGSNFDLGDEILIDFDSIATGSILPGSIQGLGDITDEDGVYAYFTNLTRASDTMLQFDLTSDGPVIELQEMTLTFTASQANTLIGTWTALGTIPNIDAVEILVDNVDNSNLVLAEVDAVDQAPEDYQGYIINGTTPVFRLAGDALGSGTDLPAGGEAVLVSAPLVDPGAAAGTSYVFVRTAMGANPMVLASADLAAIVANPDANNTFVDGDVLTADWQLLAVEGEISPISGTFVLDVKGFGNSTDVSGR